MDDDVAEAFNALVESVGNQQAHDIYTLVQAMLYEHEHRDDK